MLFFSRHLSNYICNFSRLKSFFCIEKRPSMRGVNFSVDYFIISLILVRKSR